MIEVLQLSQLLIGPREVLGKCLIDFCISNLVFEIIFAFEGACEEGRLTQLLIRLQPDSLDADYARSD